VIAPPEPPTVVIVQPVGVLAELKPDCNIVKGVCAWVTETSAMTASITTARIIIVTFFILFEFSLTKIDYKNIGDQLN
jgi:hypothetical protein